MVAHTLRLIWRITGILLILLAVSILSGATLLQTRLDLMHQVTPICLPVDLSAHGVYAGDYSRHYDAVMDDELQLVIAGSPSAGQARQLLQGLRAVIVLRDEVDQIVSQEVVGAGDFHESAMNKERVLAIALPLEKAKHQAVLYKLSIEVKSPAKGIAGHPHCIVAKLGLCNAEGLVAFYGFLTGWIALLLGILILVVRRRDRKQEGVRKNAGQERQGGEKEEEAKLFSAL